LTNKTTILSVRIDDETDEALTVWCRKKYGRTPSKLIQLLLSDFLIVLKGKYQRPSMVGIDAEVEPTRRKMKITDVLSEMSIMAADKSVNEEIRAKLFVELAQYFYNKKSKKEGTVADQQILICPLINDICRNECVWLIDPDSVNAECAMLLIAHAIDKIAGSK
jgi:hypothetical protein